MTFHHVIRVWLGTNNKTVSYVNEPELCIDRSLPSCDFGKKKPFFFLSPQKYLPSEKFGNIDPMKGHRKLISASSQSILFKGQRFDIKPRKSCLLPCLDIFSILMIYSPPSSRFLLLLIIRKRLDGDRLNFYGWID